MIYHVDIKCILYIYFIISYYKLILIYINHKYIFNKISFVNIEINSLLQIIIHQFIMIYSQKPLYTFIENKDIILIIYFI